MIDWNLIPKEYVMLDARCDFSGANLYSLYSLDNKSGVVNWEGEEAYPDVLLSVRPSAVIDVVNALIDKTRELESKIIRLEGKE
jgi:hypothetical protein